MSMSVLIGMTVYLLALINPASKIFLLSSMDPPYTWKRLVSVSLHSTLVAFLILTVLAVAGNLLLHKVFRIELYSLQVAGGIVLLTVGFNAVQKGRFYENAALRNVSDISVVPLAAPLIAGPGTIVATIHYVSQHGVAPTLAALSVALTANLLIMLSSLAVGHFLERINATGPLIRITGLIVMAVAIQMVLNGGTTWLQVVFPP